MEKERPKVGVGVFIVKNNQVLLGQRLNAHGEGTWCPPGGHLEFGESWEDCVIRETQEECGLEIENVRLGFVSNDLHGHEKHYVTLIMVADYVSGEPQILEPEKMIKWDWFDWQHFPDKLFLPVETCRDAGFDPATCLRGLDRIYEN